MENQNINLIENENKSTKSKLLTWVATILLGAVVGVGAVLSTISPKYQKSSAVSYDDESYQITLTANELNNVRFINLANTLISNDYAYLMSLEDSSMSYNSETANIADMEVLLSYTYMVDNPIFVWFPYDSNIITSPQSQYIGYFSYGAEAFDYSTPFTFDIVWVLNDSCYSALKSAIDLDISSYNYNNSTQHWFDELISLLTGGIVGLSGGIGSGVSTLVSDIFISNNALSVMGGMIVVFVAISLAIGLCRWVMNFLTSLGAKK